jgi:hypothetical protein
MRAAIILLASAIVFAFASAPASAASLPVPIDGELTIAAQPGTITFGAATTISGKVTGGYATEHVVTLQANPAPYKGAFANVATTTTDANGNYAFKNVKPALNTRYQASTDCLAVCPLIICPVEIASPLPCGGTFSPQITVAVRLRLTLHLSDPTPFAGERVRFFGSAAPAHDGARVRIQRRTGSHGWVTVRRTKLKDSGEDRSRFSSTIQLRASSRYRARVHSDGVHATGTSRAKTISIH